MRLPGSTLIASGLVLCCAATLFAQTASGTDSSPAPDAVQGLINLDVVVTDNSGKAIPGLGPTDFTLLDNGEAQKILSFSAFGGNSYKPDPPVAVILVIDTIGMRGYLEDLEREEVEKFLRRNGGHLEHPFRSSGFPISASGR